MYKICLHPSTKEEMGVWKDQMTLVPNDSDNSDWQEYQQWLAQGNQPEPADEIEE